MAFLLALVAGLVLVGVANGSTRVSYGSTWCRKAIPAIATGVRMVFQSPRCVYGIPGHMVGATAAVALDRRKSGRV